jgi:RimJ/RimL family protein N-acetyltransferase
MFARTKRLTLRPAWPEDAPALAAAIGHETVIRNLARVPLPYTLADAEAFFAHPRAPDEAVFLIVAHDGAPQVVGGIGLHAEEDGMQLGYWLTPGAWGRGYATEAGRAVIAMARHALPLRRIGAWHFVDNPASGRVLRKLGFGPTGRTFSRPSIGREEQASALEYDLDLDDDRAPMPIAA